jgi:hypothetical protein
VLRSRKDGAQRMDEARCRRAREGVISYLDLW